MTDTASFFDMDHTITWQNSGLSFIRYAAKRGMVPPAHMLKSMVRVVLYRLSLINIESWYEKSMENLAGAKLNDIDDFCSLWFNETLRKAVYKEALDLIQKHKGRGHRVVIISNSPIFFVKPMAAALEVKDIICSQVEIEGEKLTGRLIKPLCYGEGKKIYAQKWSLENGIDLMKSYFYTDSFFDIDLMKAVGFPCATNPDLRLRKAAMSFNWPIQVFRKESAF